jgi:PEP-CTERM motif
MSAKVCVAVALAAGAGGPTAHPSSEPPIVAGAPAGVVDEPTGFVLPALANPADPPGPPDPGDPTGSGYSSSGLDPIDPGDAIAAPIEFDWPDHNPLSDPAVDFYPGDPGDPAGPPGDARPAGFTPAPVPEPSTFAIFGLGLLELIFLRRSSGANRPA